MVMSSKVSVIVPVKNAEKKIIKCLDAVFTQSLFPYEVIVVDGHSTDNTVNNARNFDIVLFYENYGTVGGARKIGVENAKGDYVAFTDADCIPDKDWLINLVKEFDEGIVGVGGATVNLGHGVWQESISLILNSFLGGANSVQDRTFKNHRFVKSISGCNSIYRKLDVVEVGNYNSSLKMNEDTELNKRLLSIGKILYTPCAIIYHDQDRGLKDFIKRMYLFGRGRALNKLVDLQIVPPILALITVIFLFTSIKVFTFMIILYLSIVLIFDLFLFKTHKKPMYLGSIPIVFFLEHVFYTLGFWCGITKLLIGGEK